MQTYMKISTLSQLTIATECLQRQLEQWDISAEKKMDIRLCVMEASIKYPAHAHPITHRCRSRCAAVLGLQIHCLPRKRKIRHNCIASSNVPLAAALQHFRITEVAQPTLEEEVTRLVDAGMKRIVIVPMFLTRGNHLSNKIPHTLEALRKKYPHIQIELTRHLGVPQQNHTLSFFHFFASIAYYTSI